MNILLDTTIQIDRILGSRERQKSIGEVLDGNDLFCSTYVLGEYYSNIINDFLTLYGLFLIDRNLAETGKRISERVFGRSQSRVAKLYAAILEMCEFNVDEIEDVFSLGVDLLQDEFYNGLKEILDITGCARANAKVEYEDEVPVLHNIKCDKKQEICRICSFWKEFKKEVRKIIGKNEVDEKIRYILKSAEGDEKEYRGNNCKTLGDTIILLEALKCGQEFGVCSSNKKDFQSICEAIGVKLVIPDYSWKKST